jgi:hypothetical protein
MFATLLPVDQQVSFTGRIFGFLLLLGLVLAVLGWLAKARRLRQFALAAMAAVALCWILLIVTRPAWLKVAMRSFPFPPLQPRSGPPAATAWKPHNST